MTMTIEERLEKLERELAREKCHNRWHLLIILCGAVFVFAGLYAAGVAIGQGGAVEEVRAKKFILEDDNNEIRATLCMIESGPSLFLFDESGESRTILGISKDGPFLSLNAENGWTRALLIVLENFPRLDLYDKNGRHRTALSINEFGPYLSLYDENATKRAALGTSQTEKKDGGITTYPESSLLLFDPDNTVIWSAP